MRRCAVVVGLLLGLSLALPAETAQPNAKPKSAASSAVDGDLLPPGQFTGTLVKVPNSDRMFTLKITYPEVRLKPGAKPPTGGIIRLPYVQNANQQFQQLQRLQQQMVRNSVPHHAIHNMMQMQQAFVQMQMNQQRLAQQEMQVMARIQQQQVRAQQQLLQQELRLLQQQIRAIQNMYEVVKVTRDFDFQAAENVKVRIKNLPEQFDDKGNIKKYSPQERIQLKGKDKNLIGYESSPDNLKPGQVVLVVLRAHKKTSPAGKVAAPGKNKDADKDKVADADKDKDKDTDTAIQHKMQARMILILQDANSSPSTTPTKKK